MVDDDEIEQCLEDGLELEPHEAMYWYKKYPENFTYYAERYEYLRPYIIKIKLPKGGRKPKSETITPEIVKRTALACTSRREFNQKHHGVYEYAKRHGIDVSEWLPTKHQKRLSEARALVSMFGYQLAMQVADPSLRAWIRNHKDILQKV